MDTGNFVSPGDAWRPESAARYNGVSDMLNGIGVIGPSGQHFSPAVYANYFAVERTGDTICIFDGGNPESSSCGLTDVGNAIPVTTLQGPFSGSYVILKLTASGSYYDQTFEVAQQEPANSAPAVLIAQLFDGGVVVQRWTGGMIYWRQRFCLRELS